MANPFSESRLFHRIGHVTNTMPLKTFPTPRGVGVVTTTGRKSGKARARAMRVVVDGNRAYAVALLGKRTDWLANLRAEPNVSIRLGSKLFPARGHEITDAAERERAAAIYHPIAGWYDYLDYANFVWSFPTRAKLLAAHDDWFANGVPVVFELEDGADGRAESPSAP